MKNSVRVLAVLLFSLVAFAGTAPAEEMTSTVVIDETFQKTNEWLRGKHLVLTGGPGNARDDTAAYRQEEILFYGEAVGNPDHRTPAQKEMMAKRAAVVMAQRAIAEYLVGFALAGETNVDSLMGKSDAARSAVMGFVKGTQVVFQEYNRDTDRAVAILKIGLHGTKGYASSLYAKIGSDPAIQKEVATEKPAFRSSPVQLDQVYDGLIIDATEQDFRPALINRIFTLKGEVLYDPAKVSQKVLVEQGCGEYTNSVEKAKAVLASRGAKNPLLLKATGSLNKSDLQVNDEDAVTVFSANQKANFLSGAMVAFVLK